MFLKKWLQTNINDIEKKVTTDHDHNKYITTQEFNKLTSKHFTARLAQANLASKNDIANFIKKINFDDDLKSLNKKLPQIKQSMYLLKMFLKITDIWLKSFYWSKWL